MKLWSTQITCCSVPPCSSFACLSWSTNGRQHTPVPKNSTLPCKLAHGSCLKLPGKNKHTKLCRVHTQVITKPLHAFLQDGVFVFIFVAAEQLINAQHGQPISIQTLVLARFPHQCRDDRCLHCNLQRLGAIRQLAGGFATRGAGLVLVAPTATSTASFFVVGLGAALLVSTLAAEWGRWILTLGDTLAHVALPGPSPVFPPHLQSPSDPPRRLCCDLARRLNIPSGLRWKTIFKMLDLHGLELTLKDLHLSGC